MRVKKYCWRSKDCPAKCNTNYNMRWTKSDMRVFPLKDMHIYTVARPLEEDVLWFTF